MSSEQTEENRRFFELALRIIVYMQAKTPEV